MKTTIPKLRKMIRKVIKESMHDIPAQGEGSIDDIIEQCVKDCQADPEADVETVCERWLSSYGVPYDQYDMIFNAVYQRL